MEILGKIIKEIRENRNITLKEAAGTSISTTNLSRFEKGLSMIRADTFFKISHNLGIDSHMLFTHLQEHFLENENYIQWENQLTHCVTTHNFSKALEISRKPPIHSSYLITVIRSHVCLLVSEHLGIDLLLKNEISMVKETLKRLIDSDFWTINEFSLYEASLRNPNFNIFSKEFIDFKSHSVIKLLNKKSTYQDASLVDLLMLTLISTLDFYQQKKLYSNAELLISNIKHLYFLASIPYTETRLLNVYMYETYILLKQNKPRGKELASLILNYLDAQFALFEHPMCPELRNNFIKNVSHLRGRTESK